MQDLINKLEKRFIEVQPEISLQKAFELLAEPEANILIFVNSEKTEFHYITDHEIHQNIREKNEISTMAVSDIAIKSLVFDSDQYLNDNTEYLLKFNDSLSALGRPLPNKFLVISKGVVLGLVSDIIITDLIKSEEPDFKSELDKFIEDEESPLDTIEKFYDKLTSQGFRLNPEVKSHINGVLRERMREQYEKELKEEQIDLGSELNSSEISDESDSMEDLPVEDSDMMVITYNPNHINHRPSISSPEMPERLIKIMDLLKGREKIFNKDCKLISDYPPATEEDLLRVHTTKYVQFVKNYAGRGGGFLGDSTYITKITHELALLAVGGAIKAAEEVLAGNAQFGLGLIRPPGHHASKDKYGGYCIYNNSAVLARYLQVKKGLDKILILDWDAHAANGTMNIFYDDPSVMLISLHQDPHNYYPKTGFISQLGKGEGLGYTINMEMPRGAGDEEYITVFNELVIPLFELFQPDFVIGCNGFDAHNSDQYTDLQLTSAGYYEFSKFFRKYMKNKMVILTEGGYNPYMGELTHTLVNGLLGQPNPFKEKFQSLVHKVMSEEKIHVVLNQKIKELKYNLKRYKVL